MARPSKIDRLPPEIQEAIGSLRATGHSIDEIVAHLNALGLPPEDLPSRSGIGRHIHGLDKLAEKVQRGRSIAEALVRKFGDAPESRQARLNIELMHTTITDFIMAAEAGGEDGGPVLIDPKTLHDVSKALDHLARAQKSDADLTLHVRKQLAAEQKAKLDAMEKAATKATGPAKRGFDPETLKRVREEIYGITA